jgi:hypothetical protein
MPEGPRRGTEPRNDNPFAVDFTAAHPARLQSYLTGGGDWFAADREAAEKMSAPVPGGLDTARVSVQAVGAFARRAMRFLAAEAGVRQFVSVGVAPPGERTLHDAVLEVAPDARFLYVSDDPVVLAESHELCRGAPDGAVAYAHGALADLSGLLGRATDTLDVAAPVAVSLLANLCFEPDENDPQAIVAEIVDELAPGSHTVVAHPTFDIGAEGMPEAAARLREKLSVPWVVRTREEIARFFDGLAMVDPGLVPIEDWRPDADTPRGLGGRPIPLFAGVGRKP